jgi:hypothetical protein
MVPCGDVGQQTAHHTKGLNGVKPAGGGVINPRFSLQMCFITGCGVEFSLKCRGIFPEVVPEAGEPAPLGEAENRCEFRGTFGGSEKMRFQPVKAPVCGDVGKRFIYHGPTPPLSNSLMVQVISLPASCMTQRRSW